MRRRCAFYHRTPTAITTPTITITTAVTNTTTTTSTTTSTTTTTTHHAPHYTRQFMRETAVAGRWASPNLYRSPLRPPHPAQHSMTTSVPKGPPS